MPCPKNPFIMAACVSVIAVVSGCRQAPWEHLDPQYDAQNAPHRFAVKPYFPALHAVQCSNDCKRLWVVGDSGIVLKSDDSGDS